MKTYAFFFLLLTGLTIKIGYLYKNSANEMVSSHEAALAFFANARDADIVAEQEILKARGFLSADYDKLTLSEKGLARTCDTDDEEIFAYSQTQADFRNTMAAYCKEIGEKLANIEKFKSRMAVFKNSLFFVNSLTSNEEIYTSLTDSRKVHAELCHHLLRASLTYATVSTTDSKNLLDSHIEEANQIPASKMSTDLANIRLHSMSLLASKEAIDLTIQKITTSPSQHLLAKAKHLYLKDFKKIEASAAYYRRHLFVTSLILVSLIFFALVRLALMTRQLAHANNSLEQRVRERTMELEQSQHTILHQQQTLISTAKMSALGEMAGGVAHEINNPLSIIGMRVEQLMDCLDEGEIDREMLRSALGTVAKTTQRIAKIVSGLRFFARDGKREKFENVSVVNLVDETMSFCREKFSNHGVSVTACENMDAGLTLECRSVEISQVLLNLLNNSFDAIQHLEEKWIRVAAHDQGEFLSITVTDSGSGIAKEIQDKMMQPFFTTKEIGKGTGLGLSISRGIAEAHRGKLYIDNNNPNTCFVLLLPKRHVVSHGPTAETKQIAA